MTPPLFFFGHEADVNSTAAVIQAHRGQLIHIGGRFRLKNRNQLLHSLSLRSDVSDHVIIVEGWCRWKYDLANQLRGAFAIVIYDVEAGEIYAARDNFGQEPLFLARMLKGWAFGGNPRALRNGLDHAPALDQMQIADFLSGVIIERHRTFFVGIDRLPAGHWTSITSAGRTTRQYWSVGDPPSNAEQPEDALRFRKLFDEAVAFHARDIQRIGVYISGGLDSSSVLASLVSHSPSDRQIIGLTRTYQDLSEWSDGHFVALIKDAFAFSHFEVPSTKTRALDGADEAIAANDGPVQAYGFAANLPLYRYACDNNITVVLDGHGGDEVVSLGMGVLNEFAMQGQWIKLWDAAQAPAKMYGGNRFQWFKRYLMHIKALRVARDYWRRGKGTKASPPPVSILAPALEKFAGDKRYRVADPHSYRDHTERDLHEYVLGSPIQQYAQELLVLVGRAYGIECRMPFLDRDLAEFSLSLPSQSKLRNGRTRAILREAMTGRLPQELLARPDKFDFSRAFITGLLHDGERLLTLTDPVQNDLEPFINIPRLEEMRKQFVTTPDQVDILTARTLFRVAQLSIWLKSL